MKLAAPRSCRALALALALGALALAGCGDDGTPPDRDAAIDVDAGTTVDDAGMYVRDSGTPPPLATGIFPTHARAPVAWDRPDVGTPVSDAELTALTDRYVDLLHRTRWLDLVDEHAHGWPESDPEGRYWYAHWWSGAGIEKRGGAISYVHVNVGAENPGIMTPPLMEGACYAWLTWRDDRDQHLFRRIARGMSAWRMAMERIRFDPEQGMLARASYPRPVDDVARGIHIAYDADRPGLDAGHTYYVHIPVNPYWGDIWIKNQRSKDDMGHIVRGIALADACDGELTEPGAQDDLVELRRLYQVWGQRVERDGFRIATYDRDLNVYIPMAELAAYVTTLGIECGAGVMIRLLSRSVVADYVCENGGLGAVPEPAPSITSSSMQILRTHHEAAAGLALVTGQTALARDLLGGLATRIENLLTLDETTGLPENSRAMDVVQLILESAALGVPLTSREVRWVHARIDEAVAFYDGTRPEYHVADPSVPDGDYPLEPDSLGVGFRDLALPLGTCASPYRSATGRPLLDCARVAAAMRP